LAQLFKHILLFTEGKRRLSIFEIGLLRKVFGSKREDVTRERRRLHSEELYDLHSIRQEE